MKHAKEPDFEVDNEILETVSDYVYFGQVISAYPNHDKEIPRRISMGRAAFDENSCILYSKLPSSLTEKSGIRRKLGLLRNDLKENGLSKEEYKKTAA